MNEHLSYERERALDFIKFFFKIYLEDRNFPLLISMLHSNISWFGTGAHEICRNYSEALVLLNSERNSWDGHFKIIEQWYRTIPVCGDSWVVYGELKLIEDSPDSILLDMPSRFSMLCVPVDGQFKLYHAHFSVPNAAQTEDEFVHKLLVQNYNLLLEEKLTERTKMLRDKTDELETIISVQKEHEEALRISQKRYEVAMQISNITMFEYNIQTRQLILFENDANMYGVTSVVENGMEAFIQKGIIEPNYIDAYREMYRKIHNGEPFAKCIVNAKDTQGVIHDLELSLTSVYDSFGKPIRAIGVRRNVSQIRQLERENEFGKTLLLDKHFACEADVTNNRLLSIDDQWTSTLGITLDVPFSEAMELLCLKLVSAEHRELMLYNVSCQNIIEAFKSGNRLVPFQYRRLQPDGGYIWYEATINIIRDSSTGNIIIRYYTNDIDARKKKEQHALDERRIYENMLARTFIAYEINLSRNLFISGHEQWDTLYGIAISDNYSIMIRSLLAKAIHPEDTNAFRTCGLLENLLASYHKGILEVSCDYRRLNEMEDFIWVRCTYHLYEDTATADIRAYAYIEDIDHQKKTELALLYKAEHDLLTGFYNKAVTEKLISDFLGSSDAKIRQHAFIMIDLDCFKSINDNFGHVFGDAVLSQTSAKIASLFRGDDILGRIGGDEFVVFIKNIYNIKAALSKAEEIRALLAESYSQRGKSYCISASIGIAIYPVHGKQYNDLYIHSDSALYAAKKNGRNQVSTYSNMMEIVGSGKEFNPLGLLELRSFEDNISEYVFRILYESKDKAASINSVLELIGKHMQVSRTYIFEDTIDGFYTSNTYEWCNEGVPSQMDSLQYISYADLDDYKRNFNEDGIFYMPDMNYASSGVQQMLQPMDIKSLLQFAIYKGSEIVGFIGFDQCGSASVPSRREISDCHNVAQILGVFIKEMHSQLQSKIMEDLAMAIVNALDSYAYICNPADHTLLFINDSTMVLSPMAAVGQKCYSAFWARETPCEVCPMKKLAASRQSKYTMEIYNTNFNKWVKTTASWINWHSDGRVCLVDSFDITQYKQNEN